MSEHQPEASLEIIAPSSDEHENIEVRDHFITCFVKYLRL